VSLRVAVLVSGEGSNLQAILDTVHGQGAAEVVGVASNRADARGLERAQRAGVATAVFPAAEYRDREDRDDAMAAWIESLEADLVVLAGFMEILSGGFIRRFGGSIVNVHPSLLPAFAGLRPIEQAIDYGVRVMGVTVHFVDEAVDSGPIILQEAFDVLPYSGDIAAIEERVHEIEHRLLPRAVSLLAEGKVRIDPAAPRNVIVEEGHDGDD
jgi:phosphoribosylglycinamide formyltransferase-1